MKDRSVLMTVAVLSVVLVITLVVIYTLTSGAYKSKNDEIQAQITETQKQVDTIKAAKDSNNFTPEELVKIFLTEVKANAGEKQKLYLSSKVQDMDVKNTLKLGTDLANMTIGESEQTIEGDLAEVSINVEVASEQVARKFNLSKEDGAWKISGVVAE